MDDTKPSNPSEDEDLDDALEDTFPASDPIATGGITGPADTLEETPSTP